MNKNLFHTRFLSCFVLKISFVLCLLYSLSACKTIRKVRKNPVDEKSISQLLQLLSDNEFKPDWFSAKTNATINLGGKENTVSASLRIRRDSILWISFSTLGIEMARILITQDSVKMIDRINSKYLLADYSYFKKLLNTPISFEDVQSIVFGNSFSLKEDKKYRSAYIDSSYYVLSTLGKRKLKKNILEDRDPNKKFVQDLWIEPIHYKLAKINIEDQKNNVKMICQYDHFKTLDDSTSYPFQNTIEIRSKINISVLLDYSKVSVHKTLEFPFGISDKYEKIN